MMEYKINLISDLTNWGRDFVADCTGVPKGLAERNHAWWNKYSDKIQKYKLKIENLANCYDETECGCYAKDEEIPILKDQCVLNLGTFPDFDGWWKFSFELKVNSLPKEGEFDPDENVHWAFEFLSIAFDASNNGYNDPFIYFNHKNLSWAGQSLDIGTNSDAILQTGIMFEEGQWFKFTVTGKPIGSDGEIMFYDFKNEDQKPTKCRVEYLIEGPGVIGNKDEYRYQTNTRCLDMEKKNIRDYPLKVFAARHRSLSSDYMMDAVVRNVVFENEATDTSIDTTC